MFVAETIHALRISLWINHELSYVIMFGSIQRYYVNWDPHQPRNQVVNRWRVQDVVLHRQPNSEVVILHQKLVILQIGCL